MKIFSFFLARPCFFLFLDSLYFSRFVSRVIGQSLFLFRDFSFFSLFYIVGFSLFLCPFPSCYRFLSLSVFTVLLFSHFFLFSMPLSISLLFIYLFLSLCLYLTDSSFSLSYSLISTLFSFSFYISLFLFFSLGLSLFTVLFHSFTF